MNEEKKTGIIIHAIQMSSRTRPLALSKSIPMETQNKCPSCGTKLEAVASLVSCGKKQEIRVGVCVYCGYVGYIDRPQEKWIVDFYAKDWDQEFIKSEGHMRSDVILPQGIGPKGSRHAAFGVYKELDVDKNLPFLEIGSGYGQVMENFKLAGFQKLFGVENSRHRAGLVNKVFGFEIVVGVFGSEEVQKKLKEKGPFGLLFSHHVFEHVYEPEKVVKAMSELQDYGGCLILAMPNGSGEHINYGTMYLPHLHGFNKGSLEMILNKYGYEVVVDKSPDETNLIIGARKVARPTTFFTIGKDHKQTVHDRIVKGLSLDNMENGGRYRLTWEQIIGNQDYSRVEKVSFLGGFCWYVGQVMAYIKSRFFKRFRGNHVMLVEPAAVFFGKAAPFEIQFREDIQWLIK